ncbi:MAG: hypothetical protein OXF56_23935 [Rhodobacteraceae bacterium]|nr:hypothetical protein [Paracoccaceae bacterium]
MRDETRYVHHAVRAAAGAIREALAAGEDAAVVSADNSAMWAAAHLALGTGSEILAGDALPQLVELGGPLAENEPMLGSIEMWVHMVAASRSGRHDPRANHTAIDAEMCANDEGDFGARYAARAMRAAGARTVLWLHADRFAEQPAPPGAARLIESMTAPLAAAGIRSILCFEGVVTKGWMPQITCPAGARLVHLARYASPLDTAGAERPAGACTEDIARVKALAIAVAAGNGKDATGVIGEAEAKQLCDASAGCARMLIGWTKAAVRQASTVKLEWEDFERNAPRAEQQHALLACAESAERTVRAMYENRRNL